MDEKEKKSSGFKFNIDDEVFFAENDVATHFHNSRPGIYPVPGGRGVIVEYGKIRGSIDSSIDDPEDRSTDPSYKVLWDEDTIDGDNREWYVYESMLCGPNEVTKPKGTEEEAAIDVGEEIENLLNTFNAFK